MTLNINHRAQGSSKSRFSIQWADSYNDVNPLVNRLRTLTSTLPFRHPDRAQITHNIASCHMTRYKATRQQGDLDQAIVGYAEALLRGWNLPSMNIFTFEHLARALLIRFNDFGAREDLDHIISYFHHFINLLLEVAGIKRLKVLNGLTDALCSRFEFGGRLEDTEGSISLLGHAITMVPSGIDDHRLFTYKLASTWQEKYKQTGASEDLTAAINHHRALLTSCPLDHPSRFRAFTVLRGCWSHALNGAVT